MNRLSFGTAGNGHHCSACAGISQTGLHRRNCRSVNTVRLLWLHGTHLGLPGFHCHIPRYFYKTLFGLPCSHPHLRSPPRMSSPYIGSAVLCQLNATLQLVATLSPSLTPSEIAEIRRSLARAYDSIGVVLEDRNLQAEGVTLIREFGTEFLDSVFTLFQ